MDCPVCKTERLSMMERQGIEIDYCLTCRGVWLDRGDRDKVIERPAAELAAAAPVATPAPVATLQTYAPQARYDGGHRPRNDDRSAGGHRRKSFLQELFH